MIATTTWAQLPEPERKKAVRTITQRIGAKDMDTVRSVFDLVQPVMLFGEDTNGKVLSIHETSLGSMRVCLEAYAR